MLKPRLTWPLLEAIESALTSALAGEHFQRALEWVQAELERRASRGGEHG